MKMSHNRYIMLLLGASITWILFLPAQAITGRCVPGHSAIILAGLGYALASTITHMVLLFKSKDAEYWARNRYDIVYTIITDSVVYIIVISLIAIISKVASNYITYT